MAQKKTIWYSRTYRTLNTDYRAAVLFILFLVIPTLLAFAFHVKWITGSISRLAQQLISAELTEQQFIVAGSEYPPFGQIYIVSFDIRLPTPHEISINLVLMLAMILVMVMTNLRSRPITIYLLFSLMIHIISCVFFAFERDTTVYTGTDFSDLLMKQQIGVWTLFIILMGAVLALNTGKGLRYKLLAFAALLVWSGFIGVIRYIVFIYLLSRFSALYMADMYFVAGPIFDFLYMVGIYSIYSHRMQKYFDSPEGEGEWKWL